MFTGSIVAERLGDKAKTASLGKVARTLFPNVGHFLAQFGIKP